MLVIWESANQLFMSKQYFESVKIEIKVEIEFDLKKRHLRKWKLTNDVAVVCQMLPRCNGTLKNDWVSQQWRQWQRWGCELICLWWQLCQVFIEQEHNVHKWCSLWWSLDDGYNCQPVGAGRRGQGVDGVGRVAPIVDPLDQLLLARANLTVGSKYKGKIIENKKIMKTRK